MIVVDSVNSNEDGWAYTIRMNQTTAENAGDEENVLYFNGAVGGVPTTASNFGFLISVPVPYLPSLSLTVKTVNWWANV